MAIKGNNTLSIIQWSTIGYLLDTEGTRHLINRYSDLRFSRKVMPMIGKLVLSVNTGKRAR